MEPLGGAPDVAFLEDRLEQDQEVQVDSRKINFMHHIAEIISLDSAWRKMRERAILFATRPISMLGAIATRTGIADAAPLTDRQLECLSWISQGKSSSDVGTILRISSRTVDYHVSEICHRLNVRTRMQAVAHAVRHGWLGDENPRRE